MTVTIKNTEITVPPAILRKAGFAIGQEVEFKASRGVITIQPKPALAKEEYTPAQRRAIDAELAKSLVDIKAGRTFGPFESADQMIAHMESQIKPKNAASRTRRAR